MFKAVKIILTCLVLVFTLCSCDLDDFVDTGVMTLGGPNNVALANDYLDEAERLLTELGVEVPPSIPGETVEQRAQRLMEIYLSEVDKLDDDGPQPQPQPKPKPKPFEDFTLDLPDHGISLTDLPDGVYTLKSVTMTFEDFDDKVRGGAIGQIKITDPLPKLNQVQVLPSDYSLQKFSGSNSESFCDIEGFVDWGNMDRSKYKYVPKTGLLAPLMIEMSSGNADYSKFIRYYSAFVTRTNSSQFVEIGINNKNEGGPSFTKLLDEQYFANEIYQSTKKMFYSDEQNSLLVVSIGQGTLDIFILIQHDTKERKVKISYVLQ